MNLAEALLKIKELEAKNKEKDQQINDLQFENAENHKEIKKLNEELQKALEKIESLKEKFKIARSRIFIPKSERNIKTIEINEAEIISNKNKNTTRKHKYQDIDFESLATEIRYEKPEILKCETCGKELVLASEKVRYAIESIVSDIKVVKIIKQSYKCPNCNKKDNKIYYPLSNDAFPGTILTPSFASYIAYHKYELGVPFHHLENHFKTMLNLPITKNNMADYMEMLANRIKPVFVHMKEDLLNNDFHVIHADETTIDVKQKEDKNRKKSYIYVYSSSFYQKEQIQIYEFSESRSPINIGNWLQNYHGYIICDDYNGYDKIRLENPNIKLQRCWVHAKRKFMDIIKNLPEDKLKKSITYKVVNKISELFAVEKKIRDKNLNPFEISEYRQANSQPIIKELRYILDNANPKPNSALDGACKYINKIWNDLLPYLSNGYLEMSNNTAERAVRPFVVLRKQFVSAGSNKGAEITTIIFSIIRTALNNNLDPYKYLNFITENIDKYPIEQILPYSKEIGEML